METYLIKRTDKLHEKIRFVARAIAKDSTRYALNVMQVINGAFVGTDGRRLHIAYFCGDYIDNGLYMIVKNTKSEIIICKNNDAGSFPNWDVIFSDDYCGSFSAGFIDGVAAGLGKKDICLNSKYIADVIDNNDGANGDNWDVLFNASDRPVLFQFRNEKDLVTKEAIIMPVKIKAIEYTGQTKRSKNILKEQAEIVASAA